MRSLIELRMQGGRAARQAEAERVRAEEQAQVRAELDQSTVQSKPVEGHRTSLERALEPRRRTNCRHDRVPRARGGAGPGARRRAGRKHAEQALLAFFSSRAAACACEELARAHAEIEPDAARSKRR